MTQKRKRYDKQFKIAAARVVLGGEMRAVDLARELGIKDSTLRRWAQEYEEMGENAFPGNGSPKVNKDYEIVKLRKRIAELERENGMQKTSGPSRAKAMREARVPRRA
ncbi:transposase [Senegalimassilia sp.]|uniref:transposase n=1 Tax=Senegalimassilia sp. TaxID=1922200 RepID=UPI00284B22B3|nr:transposase [Senegalimassilia sp.]MDR3885571.1 transposase [Senegalimassilia sp.]